MWSACHELAAFLVARPESLRSDTTSFFIGAAPVDATLLSAEERQILIAWQSLQADTSLGPSCWRWKIPAHSWPVAQRRVRARRSTWP
jgi:hypothetical protein